MPRYVKQHDHYSCAPISVANALKWLGKIKGYEKHRKSLFKLCDTVPRYGSSKTGRGVTKKIPSAIHVESPKLKFVDMWLEMGGAIVFSYKYLKKGKAYGHATFCCGKTKKSYIFINNKKGITRQFLNKKGMREILKGVEEWTTHAWFITKNNTLT